LIACSQTDAGGVCRFIDVDGDYGTDRFKRIANACCTGVASRTLHDELDVVRHYKILRAPTHLAAYQSS
jgi:hypothetical protein